MDANVCQRTFAVTLPAVEVSLEKNSATVTATKEISIDEFAKVIYEAGYKLIKN